MPKEMVMGGGRFGKGLLEKIKIMVNAGKNDLRLQNKNGVYCLKNLSKVEKKKES